MNDTFVQGHALIVGVGADLPNTINDAVGLADFLRDPSRCAYPTNQIHLLTGKDATRKAVLLALDDLAQSTGSESTIIIYFSGHGYRVTSSTGEFYYLLPYGYDLNHLHQTAIGGDDFTDRLRAIPARKLLVLLDCCHAGGVGEAKAPGLQLKKSPLPPGAQGLLAAGGGRVLIASSQEDELSFSGKPYSAFTLALVEALCGVGVAKKDGYVRVADLALHAREVVPGRTGDRQHPIFHFEHADNFVLAYYAGGDIQPKDSPFAGEPAIETGIRETAPFTPIYMETLPRPKRIYDRRRLLEHFLEEGHKVLSQEHGLGVWIQGNENSGRSPLALKLAWRCLGYDGGKPLFGDCIHCSVLWWPNCAYYEQFLRWYLQKAHQVGVRFLLVIDDVNRWSLPEREHLMEYLRAMPAYLKAIVVGSQLDDEEGWYVASVPGQLEAQDDVGTFTCDYADDYHKVKSALERVGKERWCPALYKKTYGDVGKLLAVLEGMKSGKPFSEALKEADKPRAERVVEAMKDLDHERLCVLKALSLFATSASLEMLEYILGRSLKELTSLLDVLDQQQSLIERVATGDGTERYQLVAAKRETITERCEQVEGVFPWFIRCWLTYAGENGGKQYEKYPKLSAEHENLMSVLDHLWNQAGVASSLDEDVAGQYIKMRRYLRDYLRYEGWWLDFRRNAEQAYNAACALGRMENAAQTAYDAAYSYSLEGRYDPAELRKAEEWIARMEEAIARGELSEKWRASVWRMRGVVAMRHHKYEDSLHHFQYALRRLERLDQKDADVYEEIEASHVLLAKLEMGLNPEFDSEYCYEVALGHLKKALDSAEGRKSSEESQAIIKTRMAELMIWWGEWDGAAQVLKDVLPLSHKLGRKDLLAKGLYLEAFIYQNESESASERDARRALLDTAIQGAEESLKVLKDAPKFDLFLNLCGTYLLLAGLYRSREDVSGDVEDGEKFRDYLRSARDLLEMRGIYGIDARYEAACSEVISEAFDEAKVYDLLFEAIRIQPGWCNRAESDFRLDSLTKSERWWEFKENVKKAARIIGL